MSVAGRDLWKWFDKYSGRAVWIFAEELSASELEHDSVSLPGQVEQFSLVSAVDTLSELGAVWAQNVLVCSGGIEQNSACRGGDAIESEP